MIGAIIRAGAASGRLLAILAASATLLVAGCGTPVETPVPVRLSLAADRSALPLAHQLATAYHEAFPHRIVDVEPMGNGQAASQAVLDGPWDLALSTVLADPAHTEALVWRPIAQDALALIVHNDNPVDSIDLAQAAELFHGDTREWSQLGAAAGAIHVVTREVLSGPRAVVDHAILDGESLTLMARVVPGEQEVLDAVSTDPMAIGFVPANWLDSRVRPLKINGSGPEDARRGESTYPLALPIFLVSSPTPSRDVLDFQRFVASQDGQRVIARTYALPGVRP
jgi:phosphate transport system substrate-binding protein